MLYSHSVSSAGNGQRQGAGPPVPTNVKLQQFKPISKFYRQLLCNGSPVSQWHGPLLTYIAISEINQFFEGGVVMMLLKKQPLFFLVSLKYHKNLGNSD